MRIVKLVTAVALAGFIAQGLAQTQSAPRIDQRQENQQSRMQQGVESGQLTTEEAARLDKGQARIQNMEDKAAADGKVTKKERAMMEKAQDRQNRRIYRERHDKQRVGK